MEESWRSEWGFLFRLTVSYFVHTTTRLRKVTVPPVSGVNQSSSFAGVLST